MCVLLRFLVAALPIKLPVNGKSGGWLKSLGLPCAHMGDLEEGSGSWFWVGSALAVVAI